MIIKKIESILSLKYVFEIEFVIFIICTFALVVIATVHNYEYISFLINVLILISISSIFYLMYGVGLLKRKNLKGIIFVIIILMVITITIRYTANNFYKQIDGLINNYLIF